MRDYAPEEILPKELHHILDDCEMAILDVCDSYTKLLVEALPPEKIFHYTDDNGLIGILQHGTIWLTDIFCLNDPSELTHGVRMAYNALKGHAQAADVVDLSTEFIRVVNGGLKDVANFFVCSFSKDEDDLSQWRSYADDGRGYGIGFDAHTLEQAFFGTQCASRWGCSTFPLSYDEQMLSELHAKMIEIVLCRVRDPGQMRLDKEHRQIFIRGLARRLALGCVNISLFFKHPAYKNEKEYRFLRLHRSNDFLEGIKFWVRPYRLVRYMEFHWRQLALDALKEITVGPSADPAAGRQLPFDCLKVFVPEKRSIPITRSPIPYRGH